MRLLIAVPSLDYIHADFVKSLIGLQEQLRADNIDFKTEILTGTLVYIARDKLACKAINEGFTHVLWFDADMLFTPNTFNDLYEAGKDFVAGVFHSRRPGYVSCIFKNLDTLRTLERYKDGQYPRDTFEIAGCGFGCVLISVEVLKAVQQHFKTCFLPMADWGEDLAFCKRARELGFKIYCEPTVRVGHIGHVAIYPEEETRYNEMLFRNKE